MSRWKINEDARKDYLTGFRKRKQARREDKSKIKALDIELQDVTVDKDGLAEELKLIVDQIEFLSQASRS